MARQYYRFLHNRNICAQGSDDEFTTKWLLTYENMVITTIDRKEVETSLSWVNVTDNDEKKTNRIY